MSFTQLVLYEEEFQRINDILIKLYSETNAKVIFLVDRNGQLIANTGETENLDTTSLASLTAGNIAATGSMAKLLGEKEFTIIFHEGYRDNIYISIVGRRVIMVVIFDERSSLGLVRLRAKKAGEDLTTIFDDLLKKADAKTEEGISPFAEITDDDIDKLFS